MKVRSVILCLLSLAFLFDSFALGLVKGSPAWLQSLESSSAIMMYAIPAFQSISFPMLVLIYAGSLFELFMLGRMSRYIRGWWQRARALIGTLA